MTETRDQDPIVPPPSIPVACTLTTKERAVRSVEWSDLAGQALNAERVGNGVVMTFPPGLADDVEDLAGREATCCAFLTLTTTRSPSNVRLTITSDDPDARPVIDLIAGLTDR